MLSKFVLLFVSFSVVSSIKGPECAQPEFFKVLGCIGGLSQFVSIQFDLTKPEERQNFTESCKVATDCFGDITCLHADRLKLFLSTYCGYSTFLETEFKECNDKLNKKENNYSCEKSFKSFFDNGTSETEKCENLTKATKCITKEVGKICSAEDASKMNEYLTKMYQGLSCDLAKSQ
ncbi:unnamed protein product [Caenorhabditis angaria]|uniref:T20D4.11-like domain-containing protein n=1 Tax=Caenorhabditis angaria TaxID=860376 RepID=A0A9P1N5S2_9PELO|nr:unnamed protein product [Caenorhabditis angaria]